MVELTIIASFIAGIVSFLSPCVLPLIPAFLAYLSGTSVGQKGARLKVFGEIEKDIKIDLKHKIKNLKKDVT